MMDLFQEYIITNMKQIKYLKFSLQSSSSKSFQIECNMQYERVKY
ncbi:unnamed protein product [Paramecium primaurelia]|uniref:Uncharacterized protein n=1 Tax=Paramecium primaurelia TaxID=5886 RepID=A0A8S1NUJ1_PARPR|nr:unnamed protein product [Paramecium primaurelia]